MRQNPWISGLFVVFALLCRSTLSVGQPWGGEPTLDLAAGNASLQRVEAERSEAIALPVRTDTLRLISRALLGPARTVVARGDYAYVGTGGALVVFDVSTPEEPVLRSTTYLTNALDGSPDAIRDIALMGAYAYAVGAQLHLFDLSDPARPQPLEPNVPLRGGNAIEIVDGYAYITTGHTGLRILDLSDPAAPVQQSTFAYDFTQDVRVIGDVAYVVDAEGVTDDAAWAFYTLDVSDKQNPQPLGYYQPPSEDTHLEIFEPVAYLGDGSALELVDVSDPAVLRPLSERPYRILDLKVADSLLFISGRAPGADYGLGILSLADPVVPQARGFVPGLFEQIHIETETAYLAADTEGLRVVDAARPDDPVEVGGYRTGAGALRVWTFDDRAYVQDGFDADTRGVSIIDVADPRSPETLGYLPMPTLQDLHAAQDYLYLAADGLFIYDLADPAQPRLMWQQDEVDGVALDLEDERVYLLTKTRLTVFDVSDPTHPVAVGGFDVAGGQAVLVQKQVAYLACGTAGLKVLDVADPEAIVEVGRWHDAAFVRDVFVENGYAYVGSEKSDASGEIYVLDLADLTALRQVNVFDISTARRANYPDLFINEGYVLAADEQDGLTVIEVLGPATIRRLGTVQRGAVKGVFMQEDFIFITFEQGGLYIMQLADTDTAVEEPPPDFGDRFELQPNYPNPFRHHTRIPYEVSALRRVQLVVHDILGRPVKTLLDQVTPPGYYEVIWDGTDERGVPTASGFYLYCRKVGSQVHVRTLTRVR